MPSYSGVWNLVSQYQAKASLQWPQAPGAPTSVSATAGNAQATVSFTAPTFTGIPPGITGFLATSSPDGITATGASSPLTVTGLTNGTAYTFAVQATNSIGFGPAGTSGSVTPAQLQRGVFGGGSAPSASNVIDFVNISSAGNATDFGDLTLARYGLASCSSSTRGIWAGGEGASRTNVIDYVTISSLGNAADFGDLSVIDSNSTTAFLAACSNETRGIIGGGENAENSSGWNVIQYITIASTGNTTNFGDLTLARRELSSCSSTTRGVWGGGRSSGSTYLDRIDFVTITSTGNASNFGNLTVARTNLAACSSSTRGVFGGGNAASNTNTLDYITIASTGNAVDFGDLTVVCNGVAATSGTTRGVFALGGGDSGRLAEINFVTIATTGNATSFGNLTQARNLLAACSSAHGGL